LHGRQWPYRQWDPSVVIRADCTGIRVFLALRLGLQFYPRNSIASPSGPENTTRRHPSSRFSRAAVACGSVKTGIPAFFSRLTSTSKSSVSKQ